MRTIFAYIFIIFCCNIFAYTQSEAIDIMIKANVELEKENYEKALNNYKKLNNKSLKNNLKYKAQLKKGICYANLNKFPQAINILEEIEKDRKGYASYELAKIFSKKHEPQKSLEYLKIHIKSKYRKTESRIKLSEDFNGIKNTSYWKDFWAEEHYTKIDQEIAHIHYLIKYEDYYEALEVIENSMESKRARKAELHYCRALVYKYLNDNKAAIKELDKAIKIKKKEKKYFDERIVLQNQERKYKKVLKDLNYLLLISPDDLSLYIKKSKIQAQIGNYNAARKNLQYCSKFIENAEINYLMGDIEYKAENFLEALKYFNKALEKDKSKDNYFIGKARILGKTNAIKEACDNYSMALDINPKNATVYVERGKIRYRKGDYKGACYDYKKAIQLGNKDAIKLYSLYCQ